MIANIFKKKIILLVQYLAASVVPLFLTPYIVKKIGLGGYGVLAVLMAGSVYCSTLIQYAFNLTGPVVLAKKNNDANVFFSVFYAKLVLFVFAMLLFGLVCLFSYKNSLSALVLFIFLFVPSFSALLNSTWFLQSKDNFLSVALISIFGTFITLHIGFNKLDEQNAIEWASVAIVSGAFVVGAGTFLLSFFSLSNKIKSKIHLNDVKELIFDGKNIFLSQFISIFYTAIGSVIVANVVGFEAAGIYGAMEKMMNAVLGGTLLIHTAVYPSLVKLYYVNRVQYKRMISFVLVVYLIGTIFFSIGIWFFRDFVLNFIYGASGVKPYEMLFFALLWIVLGIFGPLLTGYLTVSDKSREIVRLNIKILIYSLSLGLPSAWFFGEVGWLAAIVICQGLIILKGFKYWRLYSG